MTTKTAPQVIATKSYTLFCQALNHVPTAIVLGGVKARFAFQP
jgi:hypothetical protein